MDAVVPAAGEGSRLRPLADDRPKPLVEVADRPLVERVLDVLAPADPDRHVVVVGDRGDQLRARLGESYGDAPVEYVRQPEPRGLADAIRVAGDVVDGPCLVCNGDNVLECDLSYLWDAHVNRRATASSGGSGPDPGDSPPLAATLLVQDVSEERAREVGVVETTDEAAEVAADGVGDGTDDRSRGTVRRVVEKPDDPASTLVSAGAFAFEPAIFAACDAIEPADTGEYEVADAITWLVERDYRVGTCELRGDRVNVNEPADLQRAAGILGPD